jgi:hypothetical protein
MKNPTIATVLNIIPGLGYIYLGGSKRIFGLLLIAAGVAMVIASFDPLLYSQEYMDSPIRVWDMIGLLGLLISVGAFMYDGYASAMNQNRSTKKK